MRYRIRIHITLHYVTSARQIRLGSVTECWYRSSPKFRNLSYLWGYVWLCITVYADHGKIWLGRVHHMPAFACQIWPRWGMGLVLEPPNFKFFLKKSRFSVVLRLLFSFSLFSFFFSSYVCLSFFSFPALSLSSPFFIPLLFPFLTFPFHFLVIFF